MRPGHEAGGGAAYHPWVSRRALNQMTRTGALRVTAAAVAALVAASCSGKRRDAEESAGGPSPSTRSPVPQAPPRPATPGKFHSPRLPHAERSIRIGFWLGVSNNEILTPSMIDWIDQRASAVVLNAEQKGPDPYFDYGAVVRRFKQRAPRLPVLLYGWAHMAHRRGRVGGRTFDTVRRTPGWLLKRPTGEAAVLKDKQAQDAHAQIDITSPGYREYLPREVGDAVTRFGTDGVAFDSFRRDFRGPHQTPEMFAKGPDLERRWPAASEGMLADVKRRVGKDKLVIYNGLWAVWDGLLESQEKLLPFADGATVEFFGYDAREPPTGHASEFDRYVLRILKAMKAHADKVFLVFGRSRRHVYLGYTEDYLTQRYDLASYLLGMTPLSTFSYHSHFQTVLMKPDRTDGLSYYADFDLDIGDPVGDMALVDGVYQRRFARALVAVAPAWKGPRKLRLDREYYTPEGASVRGTIDLPEGTGLLLLTARPSAPPRQILIDDFENGDPGEWHFPVRDGGTRVAIEAKNRYLRAEVAPDALQPYHERRIQPIRLLSPTYDRVSFRIRSSDPASAVLLRLEVDDSTPVPADQTPDVATGDDDVGADPNDPAATARPRGRRRGPGGPRPFAVIVVTPERGTQSFRPNGPDIPYGELQVRPRAPYISSEARWAADGRWHTVNLDIKAILARRAPHLTARRIPEMRLLGRVDLDDLTIAR